MRLEEDEAWPGKAEQLYVELWFHLPPDQRAHLASAFDEFVRQVTKAADPAALGSKWNPPLQRFVHDIPPVRFIYTARRDEVAHQWTATIDAFYLIEPPA